MIEVPSVYADEHRHTCIVVAATPSTVSYVDMSSFELSVKRSSMREFLRHRKILPDYAPQRAAQLYLRPFAEGMRTQMTPEARTHLERIAGKPFQRERLTDVDPRAILTNHSGESHMASAKKTTTEAPAKRPAAKKSAEAAAPAKKSAAPAKKAAAPETEGGARGRQPNFPDTAKIKILAAENPKRGTAAERFALYKNGMTIGDYVAAGGKRADINWDVKMGFIEVK